MADDLTKAVEDEGNVIKQRVLSVTHDGISMQEVLDGYQKWAGTYEQDLEKGGYTSHILTARYLCDNIPQETRGTVRILDIGAGTGLVAKELKKFGFEHIDALDPSDSMLDEARKMNLYENYIVECISGEALDIPENTYDALTGSGCFCENCHVPSEAFYEMIRLVKPGGYIVLVTRLSLVQTCDAYSSLEPLMDKLEAEGKWKKNSRDIHPRFYIDKEAIVWTYKVL